MRRVLIGETLLNQFRVENYVASGGMATIYRVWDFQRSVPLAMKLLHPELAEDPTFIARFQREAQSLQMLVHPHIVPFYGLYQMEGLTFLLERYIDGPSLDEVLRARAGQPLPLHEVLVYFKALYTSLGYGHAQGIIHCDVKPGNVLIDLGGHVYLTDFGIARYMDASTTTSSALGTPLYMAPEQITGERVSPQTDVYSLGVLLFEMLTGQRPFRGDAGVPPGVGPNQSDRIRYQHMHVPPPDPRSINAKIPEGVAEVILRAMAKGPLARFTSVQAMAEALSRAVAARFETLPDRVSLPGEMARLYSQTAAPQTAAPATNDIPAPGQAPQPRWSGGYDGTVSGPPPAYRPAPAQPVGTPLPARRPIDRRILWLLGLLATVLLCGVLGYQVMRGLGRGAANVPLPPGTDPPAATQAAATETAAPTDTAAPDEPTATQPGLSDFAVSGQIAVVHSGEGTRYLYLLDAGTGSMERLPFVLNVGPHANSAPQWSPDGARLVWIGEYSGRNHVVIMDMNEREPYQIPAGEQYQRVSAPSWLADGQRVSFWASGGSQNVMSIADAVTGEEQEAVTLPGYRNMFAWNWASGLVSFIQGGGSPYRVVVSAGVNGDASAVGPGGGELAPAWSRDGQWLAFQSDANRAAGEDEIWISRPDGSGQRQVTSTPAGAWARAPTWSPDGRMIAFVSNRSGSRGADFGELFVVNVETGETRQMTSTNGSVYDWRAAWRP